MNLLRATVGGGCKRLVVQAATGFGKTLTAAHIVDGALGKGKRVTFAVPALSLVDQTVAAFWQEGITDFGVIQADHPLTNMNRPVQIASAQTMARRQIPPADIVIIDEVHIWFEVYERIMADPAFENTLFIGLSATPWKRGLGKHFHQLIVAGTTRELIDDGYLSPFKVFAPSHPDLNGVRTFAGDYHEGDLADVMNKPDLTADVVETWRARGENRPTLCFAVDRAHAKQLQLRFEEAGISCGYIDAHTSGDDREVMRAKFHAGEIKVVCNVGCLTTGVDWDVRCIILARPTKSEMLFVQIVGRGLRTADGKDYCLILDHSDTHLRLGFVTDIHHDALDDGTARRSEARERSEPLPKECSNCSFLKPARVHKCPACGFAPTRQSDVEVANGELFEVTRGRKTSKKAGLSKGDKAALFGQLKHYARRRGYSDGWAAHKFRELTGVWPNAYRYAPEQLPTPEILNWIKSRAIAFAKSGQAA